MKTPWLDQAAAFIARHSQGRVTITKLAPHKGQASDRWALFNAQGKEAASGWSNRDCRLFCEGYLAAAKVLKIGGAL